MTTAVSGGFQLTPSDGLNNTTTYPTTPANETAARQQFMDMYWQLMNEMNLPTLSAAAYAQYNKLINGNLDVAQRGTSFANPASGAYTLDRWTLYSNPNGGVMPNMAHYQQQLAVGELLGSFYGYRITSDVAGSAFGASAEYNLFQRIEKGARYLCGAGKKVTVSFYARSNIVGKRLGIRLDQIYGSGGSPSAGETINGNNITLTSTFTKYTVTFTTNTISGKTFGTNNDDNLTPTFALMWGTGKNSTYNTSTAETFGGNGWVDIAQVQVNAGDQALPFQSRSFAEELALCKRYYEIIGTGASGVFFSASIFVLQWRYAVEKRVIPTLTLLTTSPLITANGAYYTGSGSTISNASYLTPTKTGSGVAIGGFTGRVVGESVSINQDNLISADAEL